jgi:hypothetical protein
METIRISHYTVETHAIVESEHIDPEVGRRLQRYMSDQIDAQVLLSFFGGRQHADIASVLRLPSSRPHRNGIFPYCIA